MRSLIEAVEEWSRENLSAVERPVIPTQSVAKPPEVPPGLRLLAYDPKPAPIRLSPSETVVDVDAFVAYCLQRLDVLLRHNGKRPWGRTLTGVLADLAAVGVVVALTDDRRMLP